MTDQGRIGMEKTNIPGKFILAGMSVQILYNIIPSFLKAISYNRSLLYAHPRQCNESVRY